MKKLFALLLISVLALALVSCGGGSSSSSFTLDTDALVNELHGASLFVDSLTPIQETALSKVVGVSTEYVKSFTYEMGTGVTGEELGVITCDSEANAKKVLEQVKAHQEDYIKQYESYAPDAIPRMEGAVLEQKGAYVIYVAAENNDAAHKIVDKYLG